MRTVLGLNAMGGWPVALAAEMPFAVKERSSRWSAAVCMVLLSATFLNYADRFVLTQNAPQVQESFGISEAGYGKLASYFGIGFALGGLLFGILADWISVRILYPAVVIVWSLACAASGMAEDFRTLAACQFALGLFEAAHWPCALRTTQRVFKPEQRTWGNSILQSGAALGAVATPLVILAIHAWRPDAWRWGFLLAGGLGLPWVIAWLWTVRDADLRRPVIQTDETSAGPGKERELQEVPFYRLYLTRRWRLLLVVVISINTLWHYVRVWMPLMLEKDHRYSHGFVQVFTSIYYVATFAGSLAAGAWTARLAARGWNVHRARLAGWLLFGLLASFSIPAAFLPRGPLLLGTLLLVAFGSLGLFPIYYSLTQELSAKNQGKVGGTLSFSTWGVLAVIHPLIGRAVDADPTIRPYLFAATGLGPLIAFLVLLFFWGQRRG
jgi:ACS family hexuronate transporter-like MFS transporter